MKRININLPDDLYIKVMDYCKVYSYSFTELVRNMLREKIHNETAIVYIDPNEKLTKEQIEADEKITGPTPVMDTLNGIHVFIGICSNCNQKKVVTKREIVYDLERKTMQICESCYRKAEK